MQAHKTADQEYQERFHTLSSSQQETQSPTCTHSFRPLNPIVKSLVALTMRKSAPTFEFRKGRSAIDSSLDLESMLSSCPAKTSVKRRRAYSAQVPWGERTDESQALFQIGVKAKAAPDEKVLDREGLTESTCLSRSNQHPAAKTTTEAERKRALGLVLGDSLPPCSAVRAFVPASSVLSEPSRTRLCGSRELDRRLNRGGKRVESRCDRGMVERYNERAALSTQQSR